VSPAESRIYLIVHADRLASIISDGFLWSDVEAQRRASPGTVIGMAEIKQRRLTMPLSSHPGLCVGDCVPSHFCPRSVMLYVIDRANHPNLAWRGGNKGEEPPMIRFKTGDILAEDVEALVNPLNCVGVMRRGVARQFRKEFPENFRAYAEACRQGEVRPDRLFVFEAGALTNPRYVVNFPTKRHWRGRSRIEAAE